MKTFTFEKSSSFMQNMHCFKFCNFKKKLFENKTNQHKKTSYLTLSIFLKIKHIFIPGHMYLFVKLAKVLDYLNI